MAEVFAGIVCGYALALLGTPLAAFALVRARADSPAIERMMPPGASLAAVAVILHGFALLTFTAIGMVLGMALHGFETSAPADGLGSPNRVYTIFVLAIAAIAVLPLATVVARWRAPLLAAGLVFAAVFGWVTPYLALLGD